MGALAQAPGRCHATSAEVLMMRPGSREGNSERLLIGCVSVVSDWCSLCLCDTACLRTEFTIPMATGHLASSPAPAVSVVRLEFCGLWRVDEL